MKKMFSIMMVMILLMPIMGLPVMAEELLEEDYQIEVQMNWIDENGNLINEDGSPLEITPFSVFIGNCGTATLTASSSLVNVIIKMDTIFAWNFAGQVSDSREGIHYFSLTSSSNSHSYQLNRRHGQRFLTLTGKATALNGRVCSVVPNATINHYW